MGIGCWFNPIRRAKGLMLAALGCAALLGAARTLCSTLPASGNAQSTSAPQTASPISAAMDEVVDAYRKIIVLMDGPSALDEGNRERVRTVAWILFEKNRDRLETLEEDLRAGLAKNDPKALEEFLLRLETCRDYRDADKLAFLDLLDGLAAQPRQGNALPALEKRIADDNADLEKIQALYQKEISQIFTGLQTRGLTLHREAWEDYVAFLKTKYQREQILKDHEAELPSMESRGGASRKRSLEIFGTALPPKTLVLTFDDGPHPRYTEQVLAILKKYGLHALFFELGKNLGSVNDKNEIKLRPVSAASYDILESGSAIGNHSYSHPVLPKLDKAAYDREIESTNTLLTHIEKGAPVLFRPPYGAVNSEILEKVKSDKMETIIWNVDSEDWADPVPKSVAQRVITEAEKQGRGIILFHDIHKVGLEALPAVIETLEGEGYNFVSWNGSAFAPSGTRASEPSAAAPAPALQPYRESWAAIIGIDDYANWPKLNYAAHDALGVKDVLIQKYNFKPDHIFTLLNQEATRQNILSLLGDKLANSSLVEREDRVLVFYAGHGATRKLASGRELGYIVPVDAGLSDYEGSAISMTSFQDISEAIPAKHVLFVMDSCYSGLALMRGGGLLPSQNYLSEIARREARQMFTAGGADQQVADNGPNGHSVFTWTLLQGLDGRADLNGDGVITATELAAYVAPAVSALSRQTPAFGSLPGSEGGDFIFNLKHETEFLSEYSAQLEEDAIKLNSELEHLRARIREESQKNEELRKQLEAAQAQLKQGAKSAGPAHGAAAITSGAAVSTTASPTAAAPTVDAPAALNDEGMRLYKEKRYAEAAAKFIEAAKAQPASALFANNAGFACFRMGQYEDAVKWFHQATSADPKRAIAYLNLGDAYVEMRKTSEAKDAYQQFLALAPNSKSAPAVRDKLKSLQ